MFRCFVIVTLTSLAAALPASAQAGRSIFEGKGNCHVCHGKDARGTPLGPDLTDNVWLNIDGSLASVAGVIQAGVPKPLKYPTPMPAMGGAALTREEIDSVAAYVLSLVRKPDGRR